MSLTKKYLWPAWLLLAAFLSLSPQRMFAQEPRVIISEVAWAGSSVSTSDEWLELTNLTDESVDISGWSIAGAATGGAALTLPSGSMIAPHATFLITNYDHENQSSALGVAQDLATTALSLSNSALGLVLQDGAGASIDSAGSGGAPFAGTSAGTLADGTVRNAGSMVRISPITDGALKESWVAATESSGFDAGIPDLGTPGSSAGFSSSQTSDPVVTTDTTTAVEPQPSQEPTSGTSLVINELLTNPPSGEDEWVEVFNASNQDVNTTGWTVMEGSEK